MGPINKKVALAIFILFFLSVIYSAFQEEAMSALRATLESSLLKYGLLVYVSIAIVVHSIFVKESALADVPVFKTKIALPLDIALTISTYATVSSTSVALMKGAYIQQFYGDVMYFTKFQSYDVWALLGVAGLLLWYVIFHTSRMLKEALFYGTEAKSVKNA